MAGEGQLAQTLRSTSYLDVFNKFDRLGVNLAGFLLLLAIALGGLFFLFEFLSRSTAAGIPDLLATKPSSDQTLGLPSSVPLLVGLVLVVALAVAGAAAIFFRKSRRVLVVASLLSFGLGGAAVLLVLLEPMSRSTDDGSRNVNLAAVDPLSLVSLGALFFFVLLVAVLKPRYLLALLTLFVLVWGLSGIPGASGLSGLNLFEKPSALRATVDLDKEASRSELPQAQGELGEPKPVKTPIESLAAEALIEGLANEDMHVRETSSRALGRLGDQQAVEPLIETLADQEEDVRQAAAQALGELGDPRAVEPLIDRLTDENRRVRQAVAEALGELGDPEAALPLIERLADQDEQVRRAASGALEKIARAAADGVDLAVLENGGNLVLRTGTSVGLVPGTTTAQATELPHIPVFEVGGTTNTRYLRTGVGEVYESGAWSTSDPVEFDYNGQEIPDLVRSFLDNPSPPITLEARGRLSFALLALPQELPAGRFIDQISLQPSEGFSEIPAGVVPTSLHLLRASLEGKFDPFSATLLSTRSVPGYSWVSAVFTFSQEQLSGASTSSDATYTQLPNNLPSRVRQLALSLTASASSPYQKALAIETYLRTNYEYRFADPKSSAGKRPPDRDPVDWFLFDQRTGTCGNFSSAFVILARSVGLPARVVSGWAVAPTAESQTVYTDQAHQWAEVAFSDLGWVTFEPTAAGAPDRAAARMATSPPEAATPAGSEGTAPSEPGEPAEGEGTAVLDGGEPGEGQGTAPPDAGVPTEGQGTEPSDAGEPGEGESTAPSDTGEPAEGEGMAPSDTGEPAEGEGTAPPLPGPQPTVTEINELPSRGRKGYPVVARGMVLTEQGDRVDGMDVEIYLNEKKEPGGRLVSTGRTVNGRFEVTFHIPTDLPVGSYQVLARAVGTPHYAESWSDPEIGVYAGTNLELSGPTEIPAGVQAQFFGRLTEEAGAFVPTQEIAVQVDESPLAVLETDEDGAFTLFHTFAEPGLHLLEATLTGSTELLGKTAHLEVDVTVPTELTLEVPGDVDVEDVFAVTGSLRTHQGDPLGRRNISLKVEGGETFDVETDEGGGFRTTMALGQAGPHTVEIAFQREGWFLGSSEKRTVSARNATFLEVDGPRELHPDEPGTFSGRLRLADGTGLADEPLMVRQLDGGVAETVTTDGGGFFRFDRRFREAGPAGLTVNYEGNSFHQPNMAVLWVRVPQPTSLQVSGPAIAIVGSPYAISGALRGSTGEPLPEQPLAIDINGAEEARLTTGSDGMFTWETTFDRESDHFVAVRFEGTSHLAPSVHLLAVTVGTASLVIEPPGPVGRGETLMLRGVVQIGRQVVPDAEVRILGGLDKGASAKSNRAGVFALEWRVPVDAPVGPSVLELAARELGAAEKIEVLIKSATSLTIAPVGAVKPDKAVTVEATLLDDTGSGMPGVPLETTRGQKAITDEEGVALLTLEPSSVTRETVPVTVRFLGDALHLPVTVSVGLPVTKSGFNWLWLIVPLLVLPTTLTGFLFGRRMTLPRDTSGGAEPEAAPFQHEAEPAQEGEDDPLPAAPPVPTVVTRLEVSLLKENPDLPEVWGVEEQVRVQCHLLSEDGHGIAGASIEVRFGDGEGQGQETIDDEGCCVASWLGAAPGTYLVSVEYEGDDQHIGSSSQCEFRLVQFREEVVRLYNTFLQRVRERLPRVSSEATPREFEQIVVSSELQVDQRALGRVMDLFEEAEYSERQIGRTEYEAMYQALAMIDGGVAWPESP